MFCNQCCGEVPNGVGFCPNCGAPVEQPQQPQYDQTQYQQPQYEQTQYDQTQYQQPQYDQSQYQQPAPPMYGQPMAPVGDAQERELAKQNLIFGILAIAFACSYYLSFMGIVFGAISMGKAKLYMASYPLTGKAKVGRILGKVGFILGIVFTVLSLITIIACIVGSASSSYYYY